MPLLIDIDPALQDTLQQEVVRQNQNNGTTLTDASFLSLFVNDLLLARQRHHVTDRVERLRVAFMRAAEQQRVAAEQALGVTP